MLVVSSPDVPGKRIIKTIGLVKGNTIEQDILAKTFLQFLRILWEEKSKNILN